MAELTEVLRFIEKIETDNLGQSAYEIANKLRGYTKPQYTTKLWTLATGYDQKYIQGEFQGKLSLEVVLSGERTDFSHFIASLSDQINQQGIRKSDLTSWTGDHTSWAGDIGSAIVFYHSQSHPTPRTILQILNSTQILPLTETPTTETPFSHLHHPPGPAPTRTPRHPQRHRHHPDADPALRQQREAPQMNVTGSIASCPHSHSSSSL
jgi:hypothetical protein